MGKKNDRIRKYCSLLSHTTEITGISRG
uniref:Uncharacterized protein n=1 Tax=Rhizophora mucronata TaxID=61149 RepID=A0A2P2Q1W1_RHIMU